jgi:acetyl-CoA carboxylase beta subunit
MSGFTAPMYCHACEQTVRGPDLSDIKYGGDVELGCGHFTRLTDEERIQSLCDIVSRMEEAIEDIIEGRYASASQGT